MNPADRGSRREWIAAAIAIAATLAIVVAWIAGTPPPRLREDLKRVQFWSLEACVAAGLLVSAMILPRLRHEVSAAALRRLAAVVALALVLTLGVAPRTNRIYYDEQIYQGIGQSLADQRRAQMCNDGVLEYGRLQCSYGEYNKQPYAYPHLLSIVYRLFGVRPDAAFAVNALVMALTACGAYAAAWLLFADTGAALFAAIAVTILPQQLLWSATAAAEPSASLACLVALVAAAWFRRSRQWLALVASAIATVYAVQFRPESLLIAPVVALLLLPAIGDHLGRPRIAWLALLSLVLAAVPAAHLLTVRNEGWGTSGERLSFAYVADNLGVNGWFFLADERFPVVVTLLAVIGLVSRGARLERAALVLYFALFFGVQLLFYAGSYNYGADVRYSLMTYPPVAILAGRGAAVLSQALERFHTLRFHRLPVVALLLFQFLWYLPAVRAVTEEAWAARADVRFAESLVPDLRGNTYVLAHNPVMFHVWGINAGQMSMVFGNPSYIDYLALRYSGGVYLHWNFWCNVPVPEQQDLCRRIRDQRSVVTVREYRERDQHYALYRILANPPKP